MIINITTSMKGSGPNVAKEKLITLVEVSVNRKGLKECVKESISPRRKSTDIKLSKITTIIERYLSTELRTLDSVKILASGMDEYSVSKTAP